MIVRRRKVFIPNKAVIRERSTYFRRQKTKIKRLFSRYSFYIRIKYSKKRIFNKRFFKKKVKLLRYYYFIFIFFKRKFSLKFKDSRFLQKFNFNFFFRFKGYFFKNFVFYKDINFSKFKSFFMNSYNKVSARRLKFLRKRFLVKKKFKNFVTFNNVKVSKIFRAKAKRFDLPHKSKPYVKKSGNFFFRRGKINKNYLLFSKKYFFFRRKNNYSSFVLNFKSFKKLNNRYSKKFFKFFYFFKFKRKLFYKKYNYKFWSRFFVARFTRYFLAFKFKRLLSSNFSTLYSTYFYKRKKFFPYSFFLKSFNKFFFINKFFRKKFKNRLSCVFPSRKLVSQSFNNKFLFFSRYPFNTGDISELKNTVVFFNRSFPKNFKKFWFFHSRAFKHNRYINFCRFTKLNYFKKFIFRNRQKFKLIYNNLLSFSKSLKLFKDFKFQFFIRNKFNFNKNFCNLKSFKPFYKRFIFPTTSLSYVGNSSNFFSRSIFRFFFSSIFFKQHFSISNFSPRFSFKFFKKFEKFKFFKLKGFHRNRNKRFFFGTSNNKYNVKRFKKVRRKFNRKINILKYFRPTLFYKRGKTYFYKFYRRLSMFFRRRSSSPFSYKVRSNFNNNTFMLRHFFLNHFLSRNLFYYNYNKFFRQFYFFRRRHKIYCSAFSARFRKLYRIKNRFKRKRRKFLRKIRFNFFIASHYARKNYDNYNKEKNFVSLFHTKNNFFIYVHNVNGKIIHQSTNGMVGYKGPKKPTAFAAEINARRVAKAIKYSKIFPIVLIIRTRLSSFVRSAIRGMNYMGLKFSYVKRIILKGHNGLRKPGLRRT